MIIGIGALLYTVENKKRPMGADQAWVAIGV